MRDELKQLYEMIDDIEIGMMTTRRGDGHLESRAMASQKQAPGADLWFVTTENTAKLRDLAGDPHLNIGFYHSKTREWISVSGIARLSRDKRTIAALYAADWRAWFPDEGDPRHGTPDDPRIVLIGIDIHAAVYLEVDKPRPVVLYEMAKGWLTGTLPDIGEMHTVRPG